jgi:hypothetical protein
MRDHLAPVLLNGIGGDEVSSFHFEIKLGKACEGGFLPRSGGIEVLCHG